MTCLLTDIPTRADLVGIERDLSHAIQVAKSAGAPLYFLPTSDNAKTFERPYVHHIYGCLENGAKAMVILTGIEAFFLIKVEPNARLGIGSIGDAPPGMPPIVDVDKFRSAIYDLSRTQKLFTRTTEIVYRKPSKGYTNCAIPWIRLGFDSMQTRESSIEFFKTLECNLADDESKNQYLLTKLARDYEFSTTDWNVLVNYRMDTSARVPDDISCFVVDGANYTESHRNTSLLVIPRPRRKAPLTIEPISDAAYRRRRRMLLALDIETRSDRVDEAGIKLNAVPMPAFGNDFMFMIGISCVWSDDMDHIISSICITTLPSVEPRIGYTILAAGDTATDREANAIRSLGVVFNRLRPDIETTFNGCTYDWPWIIQRASTYKILGDLYTSMSCGLHTISGADTIIPKLCQTVRTWWWREENIKIKANDIVSGWTLAVPGIVSVDTMVMYRKSEIDDPKYSLAHVLEVSSLPPKYDMPYIQLFNIVDAVRCAPGTPAYNQGIIDMEGVDYYCKQDCNLLFVIWKRRNILGNALTLAGMAFTNINNAFNRANGNKCRSLTIANDPNLAYIMTSSCEKPPGKFPGALVTAPQIHGINRHRPVTGIDFVSLYPSTIVQFNISPEKLVKTREHADYLTAAGIPLVYIEFTIKQSSGNNVAQCAPTHNGLDNEVYDDILEETAIPATDTSTLKYYGWIVGHNNIEANMSVNTLILRNILSIRAAIKIRMKTRKRDIALHPDPDSISYRDLLYENVSDEGLQYAYKIFMNTFYGVMGDTTSPFFEVLCAGAITTLGVQTITTTRNYIKSQDALPQYTDTDSVYIILGDTYFAAMDAEYAAGTITYVELCTRMIECTAINVAAIAARINELFAAKYSNTVLRVAVEETGFPSFYACRKKYVSLMHGFGSRSEINLSRLTLDDFNGHRLCMKGIEIKKKGHTEAMVITGKNVIIDMFDLYAAESAEEAAPTLNTRTALEIVTQHINSVFSVAWTSAQLEKNGTYRPPNPGKPGNAQFNTFRQRMIERGIEPPSPGVRFSYAYVVPTMLVNSYGNFITYSKGQMIEYVSEVTRLGLRVNMAAYIVGEFVGMLARFITNNEAVDGVVDETASFNRAKAIVNGLFKTLDPTVNNSRDLLKKQVRPWYMGIKKHFEAALRRTSEISTVEMRILCGMDIAEEGVDTNIPITAAPTLGAALMRPIPTDLPPASEITMAYIRSLITVEQRRAVKILYTGTMANPNCLYMVNMSQYKKLWNEYIRQLAAILDTIPRFESILDQLRGTSGILPDLASTIASLDIIITPLMDKYAAYAAVLQKIRSIKQLMANLKYIATITV